MCIPNFDRARRLARDDARALQGLQCGVARSSGGFMYGFGNAATQPPGQALPFTAVLALRLAPLDLWVADSLLDAKRITLPPGVVPITDHRRLASRVSNGQLAPDLVSVRFDPSVLAAERESLDAALDRLSS